MDKNGNTIIEPQPVKRQEKYPNLQAGNPNGRPTKYNPSMIDEVDKYLDYVLNSTKPLPTIEGFANWLGCDHDSITNWSTKKLKDEQGNKTKKLARPEFFSALKRIKNCQKEQLMKDGMYGGKEVNPVMAIFLLKVNHDMREINHLDVKTDGKPVQSMLGGESNVPANNSNK